MTQVEAKVRAIGNSLGILIPKSVLTEAGILKGDTIRIEIDIDALERARRIATIMAARGSLRRRYGPDEQWDYDTDDMDESDKPDYEGIFE